MAIYYLDIYFNSVADSLSSIWEYDTIGTEAKGVKVGQYIGVVGWVYQG